MRRPASDGGFTLLEAMVALAILSMVVLSYLGIRTSALVDATEARNWRLARELAEEKMSELRAGARELPPESGTEETFEKYKGFSCKILIGESAVGQVESELAGDTGTAGERVSWQQDRDLYRRATQKGLSYQDYLDQQQQDEIERQRQENPPSETDLEDVAVVVFFPRVRLEQEEGRDAFVLKAKISTLALSGLTPEQAQQLAESRGQTIQAANQSPTGGTGGTGSAGGSMPGGTSGGGSR